MFLDVLHVVSGPVIGAVIGAFTNFIAIKMLFRPLEEKRIGKIRIPFTPGVIPKHQKELAEALSTTVDKNFFNKDDIEGIFMSEEMADAFADGIYEMLSKVELEKIVNSMDEESKLKVKEAVYNKLHKAINDCDIADIVAGQTEKIIKGKIQNTTIASKFMNSSLLTIVSSLVGTEVSKYIKDHDLEIMYPVLEQQGKEIVKLNVQDVANEIGMDRESFRKLIKTGYVDFMQNAKSTIAETFHIKEFIYQKIMDLNPRDIEILVNEAIKREMNYLVYLGGLLGFLIGIVNIFI